jgi:putative oxidoreductase
MNSLAIHAHWLLRIALGSVFLYHGGTKFPVIEGMAMNMGMPVAAVWMLAIAEFSAGALILYGGFKVPYNSLASRLSGLIISIVMLGAIYKMHWPQWSFMASETHPAGGMEFQVVLILMSLYFIIRGSE